MIRTGSCFAAILALSISCRNGQFGSSEKAVGKEPTPPPAVQDGDYKGSRYSDVWGAVKSDPYATPFYQVTLASFGDAALEKATSRTLSDLNDLLPKFSKLIRPNGICLTGKWQMTADSPYTGYFRQGKEALIIARASVGLSVTTRGDKRSFGLAAKLFPTADPADQTAYKTANFFVIDDNGGTKKGAFVDPEPPMTNDPPFTPTASFQTASEAFILLAIKKTQMLADTSSNERQLYQVSELGELSGTEIKSPRYVNIFGLTKPKVEMSDFRDELRMSNYDGPIRLAVEVSDTKAGPFTRLGEIAFTESVVSDTCDHALHFHHPRWK